MFKYTQVFGTSLLIFSGAALKANPDDYKNWETIKELLTFNQTYAFLIIPISTVAVGVSNYFKTYLGGSNTWNTVTSFLEEYKKAIFEKKEDFQTDPDYYHRVTLYKYVGWRFALCKFPWTGWMIPVARTGHTTISHRIPRFKAPIDEPDNAEGIAGTVYVRRKIVSVYDLPEIKENSTDEVKEKYAENGFVTKEWISKRKSCPSLALLGVPVEVKSKPWGVLVIDSRRPEEITTQEALDTTQYKTLTNVLGKFLEN